MRPIRPKREWRPGVSVEHQPPVFNRVHKPVDVVEHKLYAKRIKDISPNER